MISTKRRMNVERYNLAVLNAVCESKVMLLNMAPPHPPPHAQHFHTLPFIR